MGVYIWNRLPSEYQEVEYIQSSGTQYINTLVNPTSSTKVQTKIMVTGTSENGGPIYGVFYNFATNTRFCGWYENGGVWFGYGGNNGGNNIVQVGMNTDITIEQYTSGGVSHNIVNGTDNSYSGASFTAQNYPMFLFARNNSTSDIDRRLYLKMYYFKIYSGTTLVRDFIPCYRKSDSVIGLYDLVNNQFYTNSGTGTFTKGSDVNTYREKEMKNAYIGEVYEYSYDFRNKSSTILTNDGWDIFYNPSQLKFNSYGIIPTTTDTSVMLKIVKSGICSNAKKVTLSITGTLISGEGYRLSLFNTATSSTRSGVSGPFFNTVSTQTTIYGTNVTTSETNSGQITTTTIFDLDNGTWSTTQTDGYSNSGTLTSTQISNIKNNSNGFYVSAGSSGSTPQGGISKISIIVEY